MSRNRANSRLNTIMAVTKDAANAPALCPVLEATSCVVVLLLSTPDEFDISKSGQAETDDVPVADVRRLVPGLNHGYHASEGMLCTGPASSVEVSFVFSFQER